MGKDFSRYLITSKALYPALPITHTTTTLDFVKKSLQDNELKPSPCKSFAEPLIYFFYGRPAYRVGSEDEYSRFYVSLPICFILKLNSIPTPKRIYPFDSGAFLNGKYDKHISERLELDDFFVDPLPEMPPRIVGAFYESNQGYFLGHPKTCQVDPVEFVVNAYYSLISDHGYGEADDRRSAIEIQTTDRVNLSRDTIEAIVLPRRIMDDDKIAETILKVWEAKILDYTVYSYFGPTEYTSVIYEKVKDYYYAQGYL